MPSLPDDPTVIICIDLVLPMVWVKSPNFFCSVSETVSNNSNSYALDSSSTLSVHSLTARAYYTADAKTASSGRLQYVDVYMDDLLCAAQGDPTQKQ